MKFRKKPVVIEAVQWHGIPDDWGPEHELHGVLTFEPPADDPCVLIKTLEGDMEVIPGDWIIKGVEGEFYPCKPHIFEQTYEQVGDAVQPTSERN